MSYEGSVREYTSHQFRIIKLIDVSSLSELHLIALICRGTLLSKCVQRPCIKWTILLLFVSVNGPFLCSTLFLLIYTIVSLRLISSITLL
jgi:hypothetical protein